MDNDQSSSDSSTPQEERKPSKICGFFEWDTPRQVETKYLSDKGSVYRAAVHRWITGVNVQGVLIVLLILDVLILFVELFLDGAFPFCENLKTVGYCKTTFFNNTGGCPSPDIQLECIKEPDIVHDVKFALFVSSVSILFIFNIESFILACCLGIKMFVKNLGNSFDVIVITTSIVLEILLHESDDANAGAVLVVARLWRFIRIGHGITYAQKRRQGAKRVLEAIPDFEHEEPPYWVDPVFKYFRLSHDDDLLHRLISKLKEERGEFVHWLGHILYRSARFQAMLVLLLLLDVLVLFAAVFLDAQFPICSTVESQSVCELVNEDNFTAAPLCDAPTFEVSCRKDSPFLKGLRTALYYTSIVILSVFELESFAKILVFGFCEFARSLGNLFDFAIITVSLVLEIWSHESDDASAAGVLIIARIWRFIRISHGILFAGGGERKKQAERLLDLGAVEVLMTPDDDSDDEPTKPKI